MSSETSPTESSDDSSAESDLPDTILNKRDVIVRELREAGVEPFQVRPNTDGIHILLDPDESAASFRGALSSRGIDAMPASDRDGWQTLAVLG